MHFLGRLHPLLVHLPIGILLLTFGLECLARWGGRSNLQPAIRLALPLGAVSALFTAGTGWLLAQQGGYDEVLLLRHQWLAFGAAGLAMLSWWRQGRPGYFPLFAACIFLLSVAGHFGGSLTHGANFLFENKNAARVGEGSSELHPDSSVFVTLVQPILKNKCLSCHNASKRKGDLRLDSQAFIQQGGKNGAVLNLEIPAESPLLTRIQLPLHHDDHMPPAGKAQLSNLELQVLKWWITQGADFQVKIRDASLPADLEAALKKENGEGQNPVYALSVPLASPGALEDLQELHLNVQQLGEGQPWLSVSFAGISSPRKEHWAALRKVREQVLDLDLAHTDFGGSQQLDLSEFPHLLRLNLAYTQATDALKPALAQLKYLEALNLTGTAVTDALLKSLTDLPQLKRLYIWETAITRKGLEAVQQKYPDMHMEMGAELADTTRLALRAPKLVFGRSFFTDTLHLAIEFPSFKGVFLYYTIDEAASPTTQSAAYRQPVVLRQTAHVRAFAHKPGWLPSGVVEAILVKKQITPERANLEKLPSPKYPAQGEISLIDGEIGELQGSDTWLGYEGEHLTATLDLGKTFPLNQVFVHCLENNVSWIFKPAGIQVSTSADGKSFQVQGRREYPANTAMGEPKAHLLVCSLEREVEARYVRVEVRSLLKNPLWHPGKGQKCWIFVDEIVVE